ncbi:MAG TPA: cytochrome c [Longimicrobiales bacterium]|nr:cytochrome c [Longimicrobiales bacterium]
MSPARAAPVVLVLLAACGGSDFGVYWDFERMVVQPRYSPYGASDLFADGRAMRVPPEGTVARGEKGYDPLIERGEVDGRYADRVPIPVNLELLRFGRERFDIFCAACHGVLGDGQSPVAARMQLRAPPSLHLPRIRAYPVGRIYQVIRFGYGLMPGYATVLTLEERWAVAAYVQALQLSQYARLDELPDGVRTDAERELGAARQPTR